ncbi:RNA polymerase sigma factor [Laspinema olomoucense]|uniref:RNA polymerase sigma factor n=1 Tax=Laspinema olomoucense TaxID=3231600 RepID=UPI0021BB0138|nr:MULTISPECIES: sigma-70 family RNA polymerase sigma factor [unclassified Laspinema]MCT7991889.1 sigma-70 family RNA polymerase sigma factor [Laspinema sp. D3a]MCT7996043.1 sigma-70 family RNA polymerase sigma factor [Laspinema sp. D3c]
MTSAVERFTQPDCPNPERQKKQQDAAFWQQWICYQDELYRDCLQYMRNPTEAEDLLSEAMLKAWQQVTTCVTAIKNFRAWVKRLTKNLCLDFLRHRKKIAVQDIEAIAPQGEWANQGQNPVHDAMHRELENFFENAIDGLPHKLRQTFVLYYENDESYPAILEPLQISYSTARKRISDARKILRQQWNDYRGAEENPSLGSFNPSSTQQKTPPPLIQSEPTPPVHQPPHPVDRAPEQHQPVLEAVEGGENISSPPLSVTAEQGGVPQISLVLPAAIGPDSTKGGGLQYKVLTKIDPNPVLPVRFSFTTVPVLNGGAIRESPLNLGSIFTLGVSPMSQPKINYQTLTRSLLDSFQKQFELLWRVWMDSGGYCHLYRD